METSLFFRQQDSEFLNQHVGAHIVDKICLGNPSDPVFIIRDRSNRVYWYQRTVIIENALIEVEEILEFGPPPQSRTAPKADIAFFVDNQIVRFLIDGKEFEWKGSAFSPFATESNYTRPDLLIAFASRDRFFVVYSIVDKDVEQDTHVWEHAEFEINYSQHTIEMIEGRSGPIYLYPFGIVSIGGIIDRIWYDAELKTLRGFRRPSEKQLPVASYRLKDVLFPPLFGYSMKQKISRCEYLYVTLPNDPRYNCLENGTLNIAFDDIDFFKAYRRCCMDGLNRAVSEIPFNYKWCKIHFPSIFYVQDEWE